MTPWVALARLAIDPFDEAANVWVFRWLPTLRTRIPTNDREDIQASVYLKLRDDAAVIVMRIAARNPWLIEAGLDDLEAVVSRDETTEERCRADRKVGAYCIAMLKNKYRDELRRRNKPLPPAKPTPPPDPFADETLELLAKVVRNLGSRTESTTTRDAVRRDVEQVYGLAAGEVEMDQLVEAELGRPPADQAERGNIRARLYKRHERARTALLVEVDVMLEAGVLDEESAQDLRRFIDGTLRRRQIAKRADVSTVNS